MARLVLIGYEPLLETKNLEWILGRIAHRESKTVMCRVSGSARAFSHVSFATVRVQGPREQILIDLRLLSIRSLPSTVVNIEPLKGEYR